MKRRRNKMIALVLFLFLSGGCLYSQRKGDYEAARGKEFARASVQMAESEKAMEKDQFSRWTEKYTSKVEAKMKKWKRDLTVPTGLRAFCDFTSLKAKKLQEKIKGKGGGEILKEEITPQVLFNYGYVNNPDLERARRKLEATLHQYSQAAFLEEIVLSYQAFTRDLILRVGPKKHKNKMAMRYPYPSTLSLKGEILDEEVKMARARWEKALKEMIVNIGRTYYEILYLVEALRINRAHKKLWDSIHKVSLKLYESGRTHHSTVLRIQVELARITDKIKTLENDKRTALASLNRYLSRSPHSPFGTFQVHYLEGTSRGIKALLEKGKKHSQELVIARARAQKMEFMVRLLRERFHPDFVQGQALLEEGMRIFYGPERKTFPLTPRPRPDFWFTRQEAYLKEVEEEARAARAKEEKVKDQILFRIHRAYLDMDNARREVELYKDSLIPRARQAYQVARRGYEGGRVNFDSLVDAERILLKYQLRHHLALKRRNFQILELMSALGKSWKGMWGK